MPANLKNDSQRSVSKQSLTFYDKVCEVFSVLLSSHNHTSLNSLNVKMFDDVLTMEKSMNSKQKYLILVKVNPSKAEAFYNGLMKLPEMPSEGVILNASYNVFGEWDFAIWFEANNNDAAVHFVGEKIRSIEGVVESITMPSTTIKEYRM
jgi:uncharacterized protein with GYD domain